jgi:hypothetical protein
MSVPAKAGRVSAAVRAALINRRFIWVSPDWLKAVKMLKRTGNVKFFCSIY